MSIRREITPLLILALLPAPAMAQAGRVSFAVRDSAGVQIARNGGEEDAAAAASLELRIGVVDGDTIYQFHDIGPIAVDRDGTIFVVNGTLTVRVYDAEGRFVRQFGRRGAGPGELRSVDRLWFAGDSLIVYERRVQRATAFRAADGTVIDTWTLRLPDGAHAEPVARTSSGILAWVRPPSRHFELPLGTLFRDTSDFRLLHPGTGATGAVLRRQASDRRIGATEVYPVGPLFEPRSITAFGADGTQYHAAAGQYAIDVFDPLGRLVRRIIRAIEATPIESRHVDALKDGIGRGRRLEGSELGDAILRAEKYPLAPSFQQIGAILPAPDGSLLVQRIDDVDPIALERRAGFGSDDRAITVSRTQGARWERFDPRGRYTGAVLFPARFQPRHFDGRRVTGVLEDEDGVQFIARYGIGGDRAGPGVDGAGLTGLGFKPAAGWAAS